MMTEDQLHLLTAAIDGELTPKEARRLRRLLASSAEARALFAQMTADSGRLQTLPKIAPPATLQKRILAAVAVLPPPVSQPSPTHPSRQPQRDATPVIEPATLPFPGTSRKVPRWVPVAVAASLLLGVTAGSFWFFTRADRSGTLARNPHRPPAGTKSGAADPAWANWLPSDNYPPPSAPTPRERQPDKENMAVGPGGYAPNTGSPPTADHTDSVASTIGVAPAPRPVRPDLLGHWPLPDTQFDRVDVRIPFLKSLADFNREEARTELVDELTRDLAFPYRMDLFARDPARGVEVFQAAAKANGLTLQVDATSLDRLKKRQITSVVIYTESFTATELAEFFGKLCGEDAKISPHVFDMLHAVPASSTDATDIKGILGIDPGLFKRSLLDNKNEKGDKGEKLLDPSKPISAGTADHIVKSVSPGQGTPNAAAKGNEKSAVLLTWAPPAGRTPPAMSAELKQFRDKRTTRPVNAVPAIIVIRPGNG